MAEHGETTIVQNEVKDGIRVTRTIQRSWSKLSPLHRRLVYGYVGAATIKYISDTYFIGKQALIKHRNLWYEDEDEDEEECREKEWNSVYKACSQDKISRFFGAVFFPFTFFSNFIPNVVLMFNKRDGIDPLNLPMEPPKYEFTAEQGREYNKN